MKGNGFTLMEVLVASLIAVSVLAPLVIWIHGRDIKTNTWEKKIATHLLYKILMIEMKKNSRIPIENTTLTNPILKWKIEVSENGEQVTYFGKIYNHQNKLLRELTVARFQNYP